MARKRLSPAVLDPAPGVEGAPETKAFGLARTYTRSGAPIARVAGESAAEAALAGLAAEVEAARTGGRLVQALPLDAVDEGHLVRDRLAAEGDEMAVLMASIAERGQQTPIEAVDLGQGRFGLISGWRRLTALRALRDETGEARFDTVLALLRRPESAADAYRAMVDENEIRVGLSYWERARIAAKSAELGVYPSAREAVRHLFAAASRAKQSKIGSFLVLHAALEGALAWPAALPERLGLRLARALEADPALARRLRAAVRDAESAEAEQAALAHALAPAPEPAPEDAPSVALRAGRGRVVLEGPGVDAAFLDALRDWLARR